MFVDFNILNQLGSPSINSNTFANRPAAGQTGRLFVSTDTFEIYRDNGTTWDLIGGPGSSTVTGTGAAGQVTYWTGTSSIGGNNNLFWDIANERLGIGTTTPSSKVDIAGNNVLLHLKGGSNAYMMYHGNGNDEYQVGYTGGPADYRRFSIYDQSGAKETITIDKQSRYVGINYQYSSLSDQPAYTLDVSGSGRFADSALFNTTGGSTLLGTTTDFTTITQGGLIKINGFGIYPFTQNDLTTNTTLITGAILQNATAFSGTNGASGQEFASIFSAPLLSNNSSGGTNANTINGIYITPTFSATSGTAPNNINGIVSNCYRITSTDTSTGSGNVVGMRVNVRTAPPAPSTVANNNLGAILATAINNSGTSSAVYSLRSQLSTGTSGANTSNTTSYMAHIRADNFNVGAASGNTGTVANGYGIFLSGANVLATGTLTNYYALYQGAANVTGTLTNRWGIYIDDTSAKNYFGGNTLIGTTTDSGEKLQVTGTAIVSSTMTAGSFIPSSSTIPTNGMYLSAANEISFATNSTQIINVNGSGNTGMGIGGTTPASRLHISGDFTQQTSLNASAQFFVILRKSRGTIASPTSVNVNDEAGGILFSGYDGATWRSGAGIRAVIQAVSVGSLSSNLGFFAGNGSISGAAHVLTMRGDTKNVLIGSQTDTGEKLQVTGTVKTTDSITTGTPNGGTAGAWKFGSRVAAAVALDATQYIELDIGGTLYKLAIVI